MLELFSVEQGQTREECLCEGRTPPPHPTPLPDWCYSPPGNDCSWYRQCLERRYPCGDGELGYADVTCAQMFCGLYSRRLGHFSPEGERWVNDVRKCLQVSLPLLRDFMSPSCDFSLTLLPGALSRAIYLRARLSGLGSGILDHQGRIHIGVCGVPEGNGGGGGGVHRESVPV